MISRVWNSFRGLVLFIVRVPSSKRGERNFTEKPLEEGSKRSRSFRLFRKKDKELSVCRDCFEKTQEEEKKRSTQNVLITSVPLYPQADGSQQGGGSSAAVLNKATSSLYPSLGLTTSRSEVQKPERAGGTPWWGEGLPPPSMRQHYMAVSRPVLGATTMAKNSSSEVGQRPQRPARRTVPSAVPSALNELHCCPADNSEKATVAPSNVAVFPAPSIPTDQDLEMRRRKLREEEKEQPSATLEEIEERLAALRGCDVDVVRNPRKWFESRREKMTDVEEVADLVKEAAERAELEERFHPDRLLEERAAKLRDNNEDDEQNRLRVTQSIGSHMSEVSERTREEMDDIQKVMQEAQANLNKQKVLNDGENMEVGEEDLSSTLKREMTDAAKLSLQVSVDLDKVNTEMANFWQKQNDKRRTVDADSESETEIDDDTLASIVREAEQAEIEEPVSVKKIHGKNEATPKTVVSPNETLSSPGRKPNRFFGKFFRK